MFLWHTSCWYIMVDTLKTRVNVSRGRDRAYPVKSDFFKLNNLWDSIEISWYNFSDYDNELAHLQN